MHLSALEIENFGAFRRATLEPIGPLTVLVGRHGVGKSTVLRVFELIKRALRDGATAAFESLGTFELLRRRGVEEPVRFVFRFTTGHEYEITFAATEEGVVVAHEELYVGALALFEFSGTSGTALVNEDQAMAPDAQEEFATLEAAQSGALGLSIVGALATNVSAVRVKEFFESVRSFEPDPAAIRELVSLRERTPSLRDNAQNLGAILRDLEQTDPPALRRLINFVTQHVPGLDGVEAREEIEHRAKLWLRDRGREPFPAILASDGTLKLLAYAALLARPPGSGLLCLDEPEQELHHEVFAELVEGLRALGAAGPQVLVVTHSPDFLNAVRLEEAFVLEKREDGSSVTGVATDENVVSLVAAGDLLGGLWRQNILGGSRT